MRNNGSVWPPLLAVTFGVALIGAASRIPAGFLRNDPGPSFLPMATGIGFVLLGLLLLWSREPHEGMPRSAELLRVIASVAAVAIFVATFERTGFLPATAAFLLVQMWIVGVRRPLVLIALPLLAASAIYLVFRYGLAVPLPATRLWGTVL